jgi:hypothetical protein
MEALTHRVILSWGWRRLAIAFAAGAFGALAMPPFGFLPALFVSLPVAVWLLDGAAVGVGRFSWQQDDILPGDFSLEEVLRERLGSLGVPLVGRLPVGHGRPNLALPLGVPARLDGDSGVLTLL